MIKINKTCLFLIFTFVISWSIAAIFWLIRGNFNFRIGFTIMGAIYMFVPFISAILVKAIHKEPIMSDFLISFKINRWFLIAWLIFPVIVFCSLGVSILFPNISYNAELTGLFDRLTELESISPEQVEEFKNTMNSLPINFIWLTLIQGLFAGITINAAAAFGEETGWRGFLLKGLRDMRFFKAALITCFIWGIWHAPLILMGHNYPQHPRIGVLMMTVFCILLTPIMQYLTIKAKSVIAAAIAHGTLNAVAGISIMAVSGGNDLTAGMMGIPGFIALFIFVLAIFVYDYFISKEKIMVNKISSYI
jgi:membrane protease YdiL (CAAX protease family)